MKLTLEQAFRHHTQIVKTGSLPTIIASNHLIHAYSKHGLLEEAQHLFDKMPQRNVFTWNNIICAHIHNNNMPHARHLFESAPIKDTVTYNSMICGYTNTPGLETQAVELLSIMQRTETQLDEFTLTTMLNMTAKLSVLVYGKQLHLYMLKTGNDSSPFAVSSLIDMYSKCGCFSDALQVYKGHGGMMDLVCKNAMVAACCRAGETEMASTLFWGAPELNDTVSWNTLISGYVQNGCFKEALDLFIHMQETGIRWNEHSFASVLCACSSLTSEKHGREIHSWVIKAGLNSNPYISGAIVDMYCKCDNIAYAESVHISSGTDNSFSISSLIVALSSRGNMAEARQLFNSLNKKSLVVWTALFSSYAILRQCDAVFELFFDFSKEGHVPDAFILINVLGACAVQAALHSGKQIHAYILRMGIEVGQKLIASLVDMYSKCGQIRYAETLFRKTLSTNRDRVMYNSMMAGYAHNGYENDAVRLFEEMLKMEIKPDAITFIALLSACRHAGLVEAGEKYFVSMRDNYGILPEIDHYSCMIDLFGRSNYLDKAVALMRRIPIELDAVIWGTFLNACRTNGSSKLVRVAEDQLLKIAADNGGRYVQLANVYAADGIWSEMCRIRGQMRGEARKNAGCSWVYVGNRLNIFTSGDGSHSQSEAIYCMLNSLNAELIKMEKTPK